MIPKPSSCIGCPFYQHGKYFTPDAIVDDATVLFIAQNPGPDEEAGHKLIRRHYLSYGQYHDDFEQVTPQPLIGATGQLFNKRFLPLTGLPRKNVSLANSIRCRPGTSLGLKADGLPNLTTKMHLETSKADVVRALKHCRDAHLHVPASTKLIVTMGRYAQFQLTGIQHEDNEYGQKQGVVESWRGYGVDVGSFQTQSWHTVDTSTYHDLRISDTTIFMTMHIAALYQGNNKRYYHAVLQDFHKMKLLLQGKWPRPLPVWSDKQPATWPGYAAFDTEYYPETSQLIRWSLCDTDYNLYCVESEDTLSQWNDKLRIPVQPGSTVLAQNLLADLPYLQSIIDVSNVKFEDMMLANSVLWTGEPHNLNYINSLYGAFNRYKHLSKDSPQLYSALDAYEPMYIWKSHYLPEFKKDNQSWLVYKKYRLPLIHIINKAQQTGARLDGARLVEVQKILQDKLAMLQVHARVITGDDSFNIGGQKRVKEEIYG